MFSGRTQYRPFSWGLGNNSNAATTSGTSRPNSAGGRGLGGGDVVAVSSSSGALVASGSKLSSTISPTTSAQHQPVPPNKQSNDTSTVIGRPSSSSSGAAGHVQQYRVGGAPSPTLGATQSSESTTTTTYHPSGSAINVLRSTATPTTITSSANPSGATRYGFQPNNKTATATPAYNASMSKGGVSSPSTTIPNSSGAPTAANTYVPTALLSSTPLVRSVNVLNPSGMSREQHTRLQQLLLSVGTGNVDGAGSLISSVASQGGTTSTRGFRAGGSRTLSPSATGAGGGQVSSLLPPTAIPSLIGSSTAADSQWAKGTSSAEPAAHPMQVSTNGNIDDDDDRLMSTIGSMGGGMGGGSQHSGQTTPREGAAGGSFSLATPISAAAHQARASVYELQGRLRSVELFHHWLVSPETQRELTALVDQQTATMKRESGARSSTDELLITPEPPLSKLWTQSTNPFASVEETYKGGGGEGGKVVATATATEDNTGNDRFPTPAIAVDKGAVSPTSSPLVHEDKPAARAGGGMMVDGGGFGAPLPTVRTTSAEGVETLEEQKESKRSEAPGTLSPQRRRGSHGEVPMSPHTPEAARKNSPLPTGPNHSFRRSPHSSVKSGEFAPGSLSPSGSLGNAGRGGSGAVPVSPRSSHLQVDEMDALHARGRISPRRDAGNDHGGMSSSSPSPPAILPVLKQPATTTTTVATKSNLSTAPNGSSSRQTSTGGVEKSDSFRLDDDEPETTCSLPPGNARRHTTAPPTAAEEKPPALKASLSTSKAAQDKKAEADASEVSSVATDDDDVPKATSGKGAVKQQTASAGSPNNIPSVSIPKVAQATLADIPPFYFPRGKPVVAVGGKQLAPTGNKSVAIKGSSSNGATQVTILTLRGPSYRSHEDPHLKPFAGLALPMGQQLQADQIPGHESMNAQLSSPTRQQRKKNATGGGGTSPEKSTGGADSVEEVQLFSEDGTPIPGYKLAPMAVLKGYTDGEQLSTALAKLFATLPAVPTPPPPAPSALGGVAGGQSSGGVRSPSAQGVNRLGSRMGANAGGAGASRLGGTRPGTAASLRAAEQQNYNKAEAAYRQALYAIMCKVCTEYLGLPKYFAVPVMKHILNNSPSLSSAGGASTASSSTLVMKDGIPTGAITAANVREFFDTWLSGKGIVRRMFDTLIACSPVSPLAQSGGAPQTVVDATPQNAPLTTTSATSSSSPLSSGAPPRNYLVKEDFMPYFQALLDHHPGLAFLHQTVDFQQKYLETIAVRIFFSLDVRDTRRISWREFEMSKLPDAIRQVDHTEDINTVLNFFSYEHFYVIYCRFWELDKNQEMKLTRADLARYFPEGVANPLVIDRVFSGKGRKFTGALTHQQQQAAGKMGRGGGGGARGGGTGAAGRGTGSTLGRGVGRGRGGLNGGGANDVPMTYEDFVWFCLCEEDKASPRAVRYWFNILDLDGDGLISGFELESFYQSTRMSMMSITTEAISFEDIMCQICDMVPALAQNYSEYDGAAPSTFKGTLVPSSTAIPLRHNNNAGRTMVASGAARGRLNQGFLTSSSVLSSWVRRTASTGKRSLIALDSASGSKAGAKRGSTASTKSVSKNDPAATALAAHASPAVQKFISERSQWAQQHFPPAATTSEDGGPPSTKDPLAKYHRYGLTLSDLLRNPANAFVALNMVLNAIKFLQFEQRDPYVLHQDRLMGGFEGNEWDRFARTEYDRMAAEAE